MKLSRLFLLWVGIFVGLCACQSNSTKLPATDSSEKQEVTTTTETVSSDSILTADTSAVPISVSSEKTEEKTNVQEKKKIEPKQEVKEVEIPETDIYNEKLDPSPNEFVQVDTEAKPKNLDAIKAEITTKVKKLGLTGDCSVGILVSTHGNYLKHYIFGTTHKKIELAVIEGITKLKFIPAKNKGEPVKMWYKIKFRF